MGLLDSIAACLQGITESYGVMVNYSYEAAELDARRTAFANGFITVADEVAMPRSGI